MFGDRQGAFGATGGDAAREAPWSGGGSNELARQAGLDDIGRGGGSARDESNRFGLLDDAADESDDDFEGDFDPGDDFGGDGEPT
jgi:hypothetical protein